MTTPVPSDPAPTEHTLSAGQAMLWCALLTTLASLTGTVVFTLEGSLTVGMAMFTAPFACAAGILMGGLAFHVIAGPASRWRSAILVLLGGLSAASGFVSYGTFLIPHFGSESPRALVVVAGALVTIAGGLVGVAACRHVASGMPPLGPRGAVAARGRGPLGHPAFHVAAGGVIAVVAGLPALLILDVLAGETALIPIVFGFISWVGIAAGAFYHMVFMVVWATTRSATATILAATTTTTVIVVLLYGYVTGGFQSFAFIQPETVWSTIVVAGISAGLGALLGRLSFRRIADDSVKTSPDDPAIGPSRHP